MPDSDLLGSTNVDNATAPFQKRWLRLGFPAGILNANASVHLLINNAATTIGGGQLGSTVTHVSLAAIGFAVISYMNGTLLVG